ncbi:unnamed protein product, partial [Musa hybrid cultivar]
DGIASRRNVIGVNGQLARRLEQIKKGEVDIEVITSRIQTFPVKSMRVSCISL